MHKKYGDYVRAGRFSIVSSNSNKLMEISGPTELSITDPKGTPILLGFSSKTSEGPFYDSMENLVSTTRDKVFHKQRRKI